MEQTSRAVRLPKEDYDKLSRIAAVMDRTRPSLIGTWLDRYEMELVGRMADDERERYMARKMGHAEGKLIWQRAQPRDERAPPHLRAVG